MVFAQKKVVLHSVGCAIIAQRIIKGVSNIEVFAFFRPKTETKPFLPSENKKMLLISRSCLKMLGQMNFWERQYVRAYLEALLFLFLPLSVSQFSAGLMV